MSANYDLIMSYRKEFVYELYVGLCKNPKPYHRITRKQMAQALYAFYRENTEIFKNLLLATEWNELKHQLEKKNNDILALPSAAVRFFIVHRLPDVKLSEEIAPLYERMTFDEEKRKNDELIRFFIGLARIHGYLDLDEAYAIFHRFFPDYDYETFVELPRRLPRVFMDIVFVDYVFDHVIRYKECYVDSNAARDDHPRRTYTLKQYLSVATYWIDLEDPIQKRMYDVLKKGLSPFRLKMELQNIWMHIANDMEPKFQIIGEHLLKELKDEQEASDLFNHYLRKIPKFRYKGDTLDDLVEDVKPPERKVYDKYDPCPCGSGMKYKFCCMNRKKLLDNRAVLEEGDKLLLYALLDDILYFTNQRIGLVDKDQYRHDFMSNLSPNDYLELTNRLFENKEHLEAYIIDQFDDCDSNTLDVLEDMRRAITDQFVAVAYRDQKLVLLASDDKTAYAISGLHDPLSELISVDRLPVFLKMTLIPFKGRIVYPIIFNQTPFSLGPNMRDRIDETMKNIKITTTL
jgi:hypothetical protein